MLDNVDQCLQGFFDGCLRVRAVRVEDVHVVQVHAAQALIQAAHQVLARAPIAVGTRPHVVARLAGNEQLVAVGREGFLHDLPEGFLGRAVGRPVVVGQVEVRDAVVESMVCHGQRVGQRVDIAEVVPQAQGNLWQQDAAPAATAVFHAVVIAVGGGGIDRWYHRMVSDEW